MASSRAKPDQYELLRKIDDRGFVENAAKIIRWVTPFHNMFRGHRHVGMHRVIRRIKWSGSNTKANRIRVFKDT